MSLLSIRWPNSIWHIATLFRCFSQTFLLRTNNSPEPVRLPGHFVPEPSAHDDYVWVPEFDLHDREVEGYTYYLHPSDGAKCYRLVQRGKHVSHEYLMATPKRRMAA